MEKWYITFGYEGTFKGGWIEVMADSDEEAREKYLNHYKGRAVNQYGFLNFATSYSEKDFKSTGMNTSGNLGAFCHEVIE